MHAWNTCEKIIIASVALPYATIRIYVNIQDRSRAQNEDIPYSAQIQ
jgi:hypothetical protein